MKKISSMPNLETKIANSEIVFDSQIIVWIIIMFR